MDTNDLLGGLNFGNIQSGMMDIAYYVIWAVVLGAVGLFSWFAYQNKKIYIYPTRIFRRRANSSVKELNKKGGYVIKKGMTYFVIKMSRWKTKTLERIPDSGLMDEEDRIYFYQLSPESPLIQCKRSFNIESISVKDESFVEPTKSEIEELVSRKILELKQNEDYKEESDENLFFIASDIINEEIDEKRNKLIDITSVYYTPIPTDQKRQALSDIQRLRETLGVDVNKQFLYFIAGVIAIIILGAVVFYIAVNKGDVPIVTNALPLLFLRTKNIKSLNSLLHTKRNAK